MKLIRNSILDLQSCTHSMNIDMDASDNNVIEVENNIENNDELKKELKK